MAAHLKCKYREKRVKKCKTNWYFIIIFFHNTDSLVSKNKDVSELLLKSSTIYSLEYNGCKALIKYI